jgi:hypothetical protein
MGFRFQQRIGIFRGLTLNLSKSGTSWAVGGRGEYRQQILAPLAQQFELKYAEEGGVGWVVWLVIAIVPLGVFLGR